jgi:hypothetical protein
LTKNLKKLNFRSNLLPDGGTVFDYNLDPSKPGMWFSWLEQVAPDEVLTIDLDELGGAYACNPRLHTELHLLMHIIYCFQTRRLFST